jgi:hypothetical protein
MLALARGIVHRSVPAQQRPRPARELYDLREDPSELNNLLVEDEGYGLEAIVDELALRLHQWRERTGDVLAGSSPYYEP